MTEYLIDIFVRIIEAGGYGGVFFLMVLESMIAPVPSEAVMPFAGFLWFLGKMSFWPIVIFSTLGSIAGSLASYAIGSYGGRPLVLKYGKYLLLNEHHLEDTERFFNRFGGKTIFISRFIPVIRHLISLPAGAGKMNLWRFTIYTALGAGLWNVFLARLGFYLGSNWGEIRKYTEAIDVAIVVLIVIFAVSHAHKMFHRI